MEDKTNQSNLEELKQEYSKIKEKYNLPEFSKINELFDIEELDIETDFLLRKLRRIVSERISGYLRFIEVILNPSNAPMFIFKLIKKINEDDKKIMTELYETLGNCELEIVKLDLDYHEEKEAEFIKKIYSLLDNEIRIKLLNIVEKMSNGEGKKESVDSGSYFG